MNTRQLTTFYEKFITLGADKNTSKEQFKKIKLFNAFCTVWYVVAVCLILFETPALESVFNIPNTIHLVFISALLITQFIHYKKKYKIAYFLMIILLFTINYIFSNYLIQGELLEYYYLIVTPVALVFIDNKIVIRFILLISTLAFVVPNLTSNYYPNQNFNNLSQPFLLIIVFIVINYFKTLNAKNELALEKKTEELKSQNKFQSQFFTNISHEIRTPLTLIKAQLDKLKELNKPALLSIENNLDFQVNKITKIVDDVLDLAKMESANFEIKTSAVNISELLEKIYVSFEPLFKQKEIKFTLIDKTKKLYSNVSAVYLERAINNIIVNALKYTDTKGCVTLELKNEEQNTAIYIKDSGIGISKKNLSAIYNRFYQVDNDINRSGGSGIGLAFSQEIIKLHNGKISVKSKLGEGTSFKIVLPLIKTPNAEHQIDKNNNSRAFTETHKDIVAEITSKTTFLIVDDNFEMRNYLKNILTNNNCYEAEHGIEALEQLERHQIDFIITDYMMPKMDGFGLIKKLKLKKIDIPIIMLTAKADTESKLNILRLGIDDYITKPFEKEELLLRIKNSLNNFYKRASYIRDNAINSLNIESDTELIKNIEFYIHNESDNANLTQDDIVNNFNLSKSSLYRKIKKETGLSPNSFITEIKLLKARKISENNPNISLKRLALEVGFLHTSYFSKIYQERFGTKPFKKAG